MRENCRLRPLHSAAGGAAPAGTDSRRSISSYPTGKTENTTYLFFSRPGFTAEATEQAKEEKDISLLKLADLF